MESRPEIESPSPLGRYEDDEGGSAEPAVEICFRNVPVGLFLAARQHHDDLMREFAVMGLAHEDADPHEPPGLRTLISELGVRYAPSAARTNDIFESAVRSGRTHVELSYRATASTLQAADRFETLIKRADDYCEQGKMLTMPRTPEMRRFAAWYLDELRRQFAGAAPTPWSG